MTNSADLTQYLESNQYFDYDHPAVQDLLADILSDDRDDVKTMVIALYHYVRDAFAYNPYVFDLSAEQFKASHCASRDQSYCIPKAVLFGALCRAIGVPARLGLVDVKNHISSPKLIELLKNDIFVMHGYTEIYLDGRWLKATPAFDAALCRFTGIAAMEFNAEEDSIFQEYNLDGQKHMEYLTYHGCFADVPVERIFNAVREAYPHLMFDPSGTPLNANNSLEADLST